MSLEINLIEGRYEKPHVTSDDARTEHAAMFGRGRKVLNIDEMFAADLAGNNTIRILSGVLYNNGAFIRINRDEYKEVTIENGLGGVYRNDLICIRYEIDINTAIESARLVVKKGVPSETAAVDPAYISGDILDFENHVDEFPLYRVALDGTMFTLEPMFEVADVMDNITIYEELLAHQQDIENPHQVTVKQLGLDKVDNTADKDKSVKYADSAGSADSASSADKLSKTVKINGVDFDGSKDIDIGWKSDVPADSPVFSGSISMGRKEGSVVGENSVAVGIEVEASGNYSVAMGQSTMGIGIATYAGGRLSKAVSRQCHAEGDCTIAGNEEIDTSSASPIEAYEEGSASHSEGIYSNAKGTASHAEGYQGMATGNASHAEGKWTLATAEGAHAEGNSTSASGVGAHAEGERTRAEGAYSHAEGGGCWAYRDYTHAEGCNDGDQSTIASCKGAHAEGMGTISSGNGSHSEGKRTQALREASHTEGRYTKVEGDCGHAEGEYSTVGDGAVCGHAEGLDCHANGKYSHASGQKTTANGNASYTEGYGNVTASEAACAHAEGDENTADGYASHVEGKKNIASGYACHVEGRDNITQSNYSHVEGLGHDCTVSREGFSALDEDITIFSAMISITNTTISTIDETIDNIHYVNKATFSINSSFNISALEENTYYRGSVVGQYLNASNGLFILTGPYLHILIPEGVDISGTSYLSGAIAEEKLSIITAYGAECLHVQGKYSKIDSTDYVHVVGNGSGSEERSNAHTLDKYGNAYYAGNVETSGIILKSPSGYRFLITVDDSGNLSASRM